MSTSDQNDVVRQFAQLTPEQQEQVLHFVRSLQSQPHQGTRGETLARFAGMIPSDDLTQMTAAIEAGCEQVDTHDW